MRCDLVVYGCIPTTAGQENMYTLPSLRVEHCVPSAEGDPFGKPLIVTLFKGIVQCSEPVNENLRNTLWSAKRKISAHCIPFNS